MAEPNWAKVLKSIYHSNNGEEFFPLKADSTESTLKDTELSQDEISETLSYLEDVGLIERADKDGGRHRCLTKKGFDVAHERELQQQQIHTNHLLMILTGVLAFGAIFQTFIAIQTANLPNVAITFMTVVFSLMVGVVWATLSDSGLKVHFRGL